MPLRERNESGIRFLGLQGKVLEGCALDGAAVRERQTTSSTGRWKVPRVALPPATTVLKPGSAPDLSGLRHYGAARFSGSKDALPPCSYRTGLPSGGSTPSLHCSCLHSASNSPPPILPGTEGASLPRRFGKRVSWPNSEFSSCNSRNLSKSHAQRLKSLQNAFLRFKRRLTLTKDQDSVCCLMMLPVLSWPRSS